MPGGQAVHAGRPGLLVACLCAQWCRVCGAYRNTFDEVRRRVQALDPYARFLWVDVEDEAERIEPLDIENFPTLLIAVGPEPRFCGTVTPQAQTLEHLLRAHGAGSGARALADPLLKDLVRRLQTDAGPT